MTALRDIKTMGIAAFLMIILLLSFFSCSNNKKTKGSKDISGDPGKFYNAKKEKDSLFLVSAAESNIQQIRLSKLALRKSKRYEVIQLAKSIEKKHSNALYQVARLAESKNIPLPVSQGDISFDIYKTMNVKSGIVFEKEFCERMINEHFNTIAMFEEASTGSSDPDIRELAASMLPDLRYNLKYAISCQNKFINI